MMSAIDNSELRKLKLNVAQSPGGAAFSEE
jgi:hypothetical protein